MTDLSEDNVWFESENIRIDFYDGKSSDLYITETKSSFNLFFILSPEVNLKANDCGTQFIFSKNQYILHYSDEKKKSRLWSGSGESLKYFLVQIRYQYVFNLISPESSIENGEILEKMIHNSFIFLHKATPPGITVEMHMIIKEIIGYSKKGIMQKLFVEAKIIKLLILIFDQFGEKDTLQSAPKTPEMIKKFIDENYYRSIKAEEIGKLIGINQNIIRKEFKAQYHITIAHYISELRMLKAKKMITDSSVMIKEIAIECGYEYLQNFTRAFKKKFGISPENLRNNK
ncbi:AraC family transcriptional regulator [Chryseobacterium sp.]|uniref:helix-turn-helix domain-containing protein n=1 Tax=Chryseobacterium sp. TaxID=1871047 RepID=UPI0025BFF21C|nr:AraC family transcriptional regulator [Chryseobacterium sp.]MBV8325955.1 helix-turn-helix transcriptional regulator [Chryseobacterium sp.]